MTGRGHTFILAIAAAMGLAIAAVIAGCGVKAPPRPPTRDVQADANAPASPAPSSGSAPAAPSEPASDGKR